MTAHRDLDVPTLHDNLSVIDQLLEQKSCRSLLLVADPIAYESSGARQALQRALEDRRVSIFSDFRPNPTLQALQAGIKQLRSESADGILAIGGGTAIDLAKLIGFCSAQIVPPLEVIQSVPEEPLAGPPLVAIPTTSGTGSEATHFAVVYVDGKKHSVAHPMLLPTDAVVDAALTESMPAGLTAETGLDALCQAIESRWSIFSTTTSRAYAAEAIELAWRHLGAAVQRPGMVDRRAMSRAAHLAGKAINITKTTAPHAISYTITSKYGLPHGRAVALTLGPILVFNYKVSENDCSDPRGAEFVRNAIEEITELLGCETVKQASEAFQTLVTSIDCPTRLGEVGVATDAQIEEIAAQVNVERLANNPRRFTNEALRAILQSIR